MTMEDVVNYDVTSLGAYTLKELTEIKKNVEGQLSDLFDQLSQHGVTMDTSLLTFDGFPRSDIDVAQIRFIRAKVIRLRNDYKQIMQELEQRLQEQFSASKPEKQETIKDNSVVFAWVSEIEEGSPAHQAGIQLEDKIIEIGPINASNHDQLRGLPPLIAKNENVAIPIKISRLGSILTLTLTPQKWSGRGLVGFRLQVL